MGSQTIPTAGAGAISTIQRFRSPNLNPAVGLELIDWSAEAGCLDRILTELDKRSSQVDGQDALPLLVYGWRTAGQPARAAQIITDLLEKNKLAGGYWEMIVQAAMQPLAQDLNGGKLQAADLATASHQIPLDVRERLLQHALEADVVAIAPYCQQSIRDAILQEDVQRLHRLVPPFIRQVEITAGNAGGRTAVANNIWNEVIAECYRLNRAYMALKALRYVDESSAAQKIPTSPTRLDSRMRALLSLCEQPLEKRQAIAESLIFDEPLTTIDAFHFSSFPESAAPDYFRTPQWQSAAKLLQANPKVSTISLLDLLLSDADTTGKHEQTITKLFEAIPNGAEASPIFSRLLCEWIALRSEVRGQAMPRIVSAKAEQLHDLEGYRVWYTAVEGPIKQALAERYSRQPDNPIAKVIKDVQLSIGSPAAEKSAEAGLVDWPSTDSLKHWFRMPVPEPPNSQAFAGYGLPATAWLISDEHKLRSPNSSSALVFKYPLKGNYSFRFKIRNSGVDWSNSSYGGLLHGVFLEYRGLTQSGSRETLPSVNSRLTSSLNSSIRMTDRLTKPEVVDVECSLVDKQYSLSLGGKKVAHTEFTSASFPFAGLIPLRNPAELDSFKIGAGSDREPEIASSINLLDNSFSGWSAKRYDRLLTNVVQLRPADQPPPVHEPSPSHLASWRLEGDELRSEGSYASTSANDPQAMVRKSHNCMLYARPLMNGERFEYETWLDGQTPAVSPVVGLTAMLIEDGRVRLHWLPTAREVQACGIALENRADDPQGQQLSAAQLMEGQWNKVSLRIDNQQLIMNLNGTDIYSRPITNLSSTEFGWLSIPDQPSVRVRNATLTGNWPKHLPDKLWDKQ